MDQERRNKYLQGMLLKRLHDHLQILCFQFLQLSRWSWILHDICEQHSSRYRQYRYRLFSDQSQNCGSRQTKLPERFVSLQRAFLFCRSQPAVPLDLFDPFSKFAGHPPFLQ